MCSENQDHGLITNFATADSGITEGLVVNVLIGRPDEEEANKMMSVAIGAHGLMLAVVHRDDPGRTRTATIKWERLAEILHEEEDEDEEEGMRLPEFDTVEDLLGGGLQ